jgi:hypothetical protein
MYYTLTCDSLLQQQMLMEMERDELVPTLATYTAAIGAAARGRYYSVYMHSTCIAYVLLTLYIP